MPRELVLSNGRLHVALDDRYEVRDLYWPHVGWENHAVGHRSRLGVSAVGSGSRRTAFSWVGGEGWRRTLRFTRGALATETVLRSKGLGVALRTRDVVLPEADVLVRRVEAAPLKGVTSVREVRVYFHLDLHVSGTDLGDTVALDPPTGGLIHYKRDRWFLQNAATPGGGGPSGFACGQKEFRDQEGTWRDAEDGRLSGNAVSHGSCDGVLELTLRLPRGGGGAVGWWWVAAGASKDTVRALDAVVRTNPTAHLDRAVAWWRSVTGRTRAPARGRIADAYRRSLALVLANCDRGGGILAANDTDVTSFNRDTYSYVWPRDGALVAHALDVAGHPEPAARFLRFAADLFEREGYLLHKFTVDGLLASTWHAPVHEGTESLPVQEDETALVVWALAEHVRMTGDWGLAVELYERAVRRPCEWLLGYRRKDGLPRPSWDLWEERYGTSTYTVATVVAALEGGARLADGVGDATRATRWREGAAEVRAALDGLWSRGKRRFARLRATDGTLDATEDASLVMIPWLGVLPGADPRVRATLDAVFKRLTLQTPSGGVARYVGDHYHRVEGAGGVRVYPGNAWFICTLWKADWLAMTGRGARAREALEWAVSKATPSGVMAEQLHPVTGAPLSVAPLTWSHATFLESVWRQSGRR